MRQSGLLTYWADLIDRSVVPDIDRLLGPMRRRHPRIFGRRGPLSLAQSRRVLRRAGIADRELTALERHLAIEQAVAETPLVVGNRTRFLRDGPETFRAIFAAIRDAKQHVNIEYYILEDIESDGVMLSDLLVAKAREGVAIHVIYDSFGSSSTPDDFFVKLKEAGIALLAFNPVNPLKARRSYKPNDRDHRKVLVADGRLGIIGGINLSKTYLSSGPSRMGKSGAGAPDAAEADHWRDIDLQIEGPVVAQLQAYFLEHWESQEGPPIRNRDFFPALEESGDEIARIIGSTPRHAIPRFYVTLLSAIRNAEKNIFVVAAYFVPPYRLKRALVAAARRGVDVRLLLPARSDAGIAIAAQRSHYGAFFRAGIEIHEEENHILHSKMVSIDGVWTAIGSSNLDHRSVIFNAEVDAVVIGRATAAEMERIFNEDVAGAKPVDAKSWRARPWHARLYESFARLWERFL